jgi:hypothetical protein
MQARTTDGDVAYLARPGRRALVAPTLEELCGPEDGIVELPLGLMWLPDRSFDLAHPGQRRWMYATVLREARSIEHLRHLLNGRLLVELWPTLSLPRGVRQAWEARFADLRSAAAA